EHRSALSAVVFAGGMSIGDLARSERVGAPAMTKTVGVLETEGLARRVRDAEDGRIVRVEATTDGKAFVLRGRSQRVARIGPALYAAMYESVAAHSRAGFNVVVDVGHHDRTVLADCARRLVGLPVLFVGVRCPIEVIVERRNAGQAGREGEYLTAPTTEIPAP